MIFKIPKVFVQDAPRAPQGPPGTPPSRHQEPPRPPPDPQGPPKRAPRRAPGPPKRAQDRPKRAPRRPKMAPRPAPNDPKTATKSIKTAPRSPSVTRDPSGPPRDPPGTPPGPTQDTQIPRFGAHFGVIPGCQTSKEPYKQTGKPHRRKRVGGCPEGHAIHCSEATRLARGNQEAPRHPPTNMRDPRTR